jgi:IS4 transposase
MDGFIKMNINTIIEWHNHWLIILSVLFTAQLIFDVGVISQQKMEVKAINVLGAEIATITEILDKVTKDLYHK